MTDVCKLLGIKMLNTTPTVRWDGGTVQSNPEHHVEEVSTQWDDYLSGALLAYRNVPHDSTGEKPSFPLHGIDCRTPMEAALLPTHPVEPTEVSGTSTISLRSTKASFPSEVYHL